MHHKIQQLLESMTLEEKVGQLFMARGWGETAEDPNYEDDNLNDNRGAKNFKELIEKYQIGGVLYFGYTHNLKNPAQIQRLSNELQQIATSQRPQIPLLLAADQEGGVISRVLEPATVFPGSMALAATGQPELNKKAAELSGRELRILGINYNFAPSLDVNNNPANPIIGVRAFSEDPAVVAEYGAAQIEAFQAAGVACSAKHFPGHGDTNVDSHVGLPSIDHDLETLEEVDLLPFKRAIEAGVDSIMTAHIIVEALDDRPATLSKKILTDLLRNEWHFEGVIITDSLGMKGVNVVPQERVAVEAFLAGADILLNPPDFPLAYNGFLAAAKSGEISEDRIDESLRRILKLKAKLGLFDNPFSDPADLDKVGNAEHLAAAQQMAEAAITLVKGAELLPVKNALVIGPEAARPAALAEFLGAEAQVSELTQGDLYRAVEAAANYDTIIVATNNADEAQQALVEMLVETGKPVIAVATRNPYDLLKFPEVPGYLVTYGFMNPNLAAAARVLKGELKPQGKLPVSLPGLYPAGHGL